MVKLVLFSVNSVTEFGSTGCLMGIKCRYFAGSKVATVVFVSIKLLYSGIRSLIYLINLAGALI